MTTEAPTRRRHVLLLVAALAVLVLVPAGVIAVRAVTKPTAAAREAKELPPNLCATVVALLPPDTVPSIRKEKHRTSDVHQDRQLATCKLSWSEDKSLEVNVTRHLGPPGAAAKRAGEYYDEWARPGEPGDGDEGVADLGNEASGAVVENELMAGHVLAVLFVRDGADVLKLSYTERPATVADVRETVFGITRGLFRTL